MEGSAKLWL